VPKGVVAVRSDATGTFHLTHPRLRGPAERTVIEPWLTELSHLTINGYAETAEVATMPVLAAVETLPVSRTQAGRRRTAALAEAA
jgi:hypothetical protein